MMIVRPVVASDLPAFIRLVRDAGSGMTTLPEDEQCLGERVTRSVRSFAGQEPDPSRCYVFVLEDTEQGRIAGTCAIEAAIGLQTPWYNYRIASLVHASADIGVYKRHEALFLSNDQTGCSELCSLLLHPDYRAKKVGGLLSRSRLLFMAQFPHLFADMVVAELRGIADLAGCSPFWDGLGSHFFSMTFSQADFLTGIGQKTFVAELMPKHPVYIELLPPSARDVIRQPHPEARPALAILQKEGFRCEGYIDIFDGGPTLQAHTDAIHTVRSSRLRPFHRVTDASVTGQASLVCNHQLAAFRAIACDDAGGEALNLSEAQVAALGLVAGDPVRCVAR